MVMKISEIVQLATAHKQIGTERGRVVAKLVENDASNGTLVACPQFFHYGTSKAQRRATQNYRAHKYNSCRNRFGFLIEISVRILFIAEHNQLITKSIIPAINQSDSVH